MNVIRSLPCNIDYILGALMILCGSYSVYGSCYLLVSLAEMGIFDGDLLAYILRSALPFIWIAIMGAAMMLMPRKSIRRTLWTTAIALGVYCLLMCLRNLYFSDDDYSTYGLLYYTLALMDAGCCIAFLVNGLFFRLGRTRYIYAMTIATAVLFISGYVELSRMARMAGWEFMDEYIANTVPMMMLCIVFCLVFTSKEVSWYTARRGVIDAIGRLHATEDTAGGFSVSRGFLILLGLDHGDMSTMLRCGGYRAVLEVSSNGDGCDVTISRDGNGSMAGAVRLRNAAIVPQGDPLTCSSLAIYGQEGVCVRLDVAEPRSGFIAGRKRSERLGTVHPGSVKLSRTGCARLLREEGAEVPRKGRRAGTVSREETEGGIRLTISDGDGRTRTVDAVGMSADGSDLTMRRLFAYRADGRYVRIDAKETLSEKRARFREEKRLRISEEERERSACARRP